MSTGGWELPDVPPCNVMPAKVTKDGYIVLKTEDDNDQVFLVVEEGGANPVELKLKSTDVKDSSCVFLQ